MARSWKVLSKGFSRSLRQTHEARKQRSPSSRDPEAALLAADFGGVEVEPRGRAGAKDAQQAVFFQAFLYVVSFVGGEVEVIEVAGDGERAGGAHGDLTAQYSGAVGGSSRIFRTEVALPSNGYVGAGVWCTEDVATDRTLGVDVLKLSHARLSKPTKHSRKWIENVESPGIKVHPSLP